MTSERALRCLGMVLIVAAGCGAAQPPPAASGARAAEPAARAEAQAPQEALAVKPAATGQDEYERVKLRFEDPRYQAMLGRTCMSAVQAGDKGIEELMHYLFVDMKVSGSFDFDASVKGAGGIEEYKARIATHLTSDDVMARGTAALALAVAGDAKYIEPLVTLLRSQGLRSHEASLEGYDRGMAMMALALLKATHYRAEIATHTTSKLSNESEGAQAALEMMDH